MEHEGLELSDRCKDVESLDVGERLLKESVERGHTSVASLHLLQVIVADHAVDETSGKLRKHQEVKVFDLFIHHALLDRAETHSEQVSQSLAGVVVLTGFPVGANELGVVLDLRPVEEHVLGDLLSKLPVGAVGPRLDRLDILQHVRAVTSASKHLGDERSSRLDIRSGSGPAAIGHILDDLLDVSEDITGVLEARLDLVQVVVADEAPQQTADELLFWLKAQVRYGRVGFDWAETEGKQGSQSHARVVVLTG